VSSNQQGASVVPGRILRYFAAKTSTYFGVAVDAILGRGREKYVAECRHVLMRVLHDCGYNAAQIARAFVMHHSSILHALNRVLRSPELAAAASRIRAGKTASGDYMEFRDLQPTVRTFLQKYLEDLTSGRPVRFVGLQAIHAIAADPLLQAKVRAWLSARRQLRQYWRIQEHARQLDIAWVSTPRGAAKAQ
jgi:hypothetical protein